MKSISICLTFRGGKGHCYVTVIPSSYDIVKFERSECYEYKLPPGTYDIMFQGVSPKGGTTISVSEGENEIAKREITREGYFSKKITTTI